MVFSSYGTVADVINNTAETRVRERPIYTKDKIVKGAIEINELE